MPSVPVSEPSVDVLAAQVRTALLASYNIGECAEHAEHLMDAEHAARRALPALDALVARVTEAERFVASLNASESVRLKRAEAALADARNALERIAEPFAPPFEAQGLAREVLARLDGSSDE